MTIRYSVFLISQRFENVGENGHNCSNRDSKRNLQSSKKKNKTKKKAANHSFEKVQAIFRILCILSSRGVKLLRECWYRC